MLLLYSNNKLLGRISPTHRNFPWEYGTFHPTKEFQEVAHLFIDESKELNKPQLIQKGFWDNRYDSINRLNLSLQPIPNPATENGKKILNPLIYIQDGIAWWRE